MKLELSKDEVSRILLEWAGEEFAGAVFNAVEPMPYYTFGGVVLTTKAEPKADELRAVA